MDRGCGDQISAYLSAPPRITASEKMTGKACGKRGNTFVPCDKSPVALPLFVETMSCTAPAESQARRQITTKQLDQISPDCPGDRDKHKNLPKSAPECVKERTTARLPRKRTSIPPLHLTHPSTRRE